MFRGRLLVVALVASLTMVVAGFASPGVSASPSAGGARVNQPFSLSLVEGEILIRGAEEAYPLEAPTVISGQHDTGDGGEGAVSGGTFTSPPVSFETTAVGASVDVDASFSQVTPGSGTGSIDADGNVSFRTDITVDLHLVVNGSLVQDCRAAPVSLVLDSTAPWDPVSKQVTLRDADFSVPAVPTVEPECIGIVSMNVNELLSGGGHSLTMTMEGDLQLPPPKGCPTTTALVVSSAQSFLGEAVTLDATVSPDPDDRPECDAAEGVVPTGSVEFLSRGVQVGVADLDGSGAAHLVTTALRSGVQDLTARYRSAPPYSASTSAAVSHRVVARPTISIDAPSAFTIGAGPVEFTVEVANSPAGQAVANGRLDVTLEGAGLHGFAVLERWDGAAWVPVVLDSFSSQLYGAAQPAAGVAVPVGGGFTQRYRFSTNAGQVAGPMSMTFELVAVDPDEAPPVAVRAPAPDALARATVQSAVTTEPRLTPSMTLTTVPHTVRQGMVVTAQTLLQSAPGGVAPTGTFSVLLDGKPVLVRGQRTPPGFGYQPTVPVADVNGNGVSPKFVLPPDTPTGTREVTVRYSGDAFYRPVQLTSTITVLPARGTTFECSTTNLLFTDRINVQVGLAGNLPAAVRPGEPVPVGQLDVEVFADRGDGVNSFGTFFIFPSTLPVTTPESGIDGFTVADLTFGELGTATPDEVVFTDSYPPMDDSTRPVDPNPDMEIGFTGEHATLTFTGDPGEVVPVALDGIELNASLLGGFFTISLSCAPLDEPALLRTVTIAGTTLIVDTPDPTREGDPVTLTAAVAPAGTPGVVEFRDGASTLAVVPVDSTGTATHRIPTLEPGAHSFTARFTTATAGINTVSTSVPLAVLPEHECATFTDEGNAAVVRLVYLELLGRCPDQPGFDHWVGRLEGGTTPEAFARTIAATPEAVGRVVDDAYRTMLGRAPDPAGRTYWTNRMRTGTSRYDQLLAQLGASGEFWSKAGSTNDGFVTRVYQQLLNRAPDTGGLAYWTGRLNNGTPRRTLIIALANLDEPLSRLVTASYQEILGRNPATSERTNAIEHLRSTGDRSGLYAQLIGTTEFHTRAQQLPNPED